MCEAFLIAGEELAQHVRKAMVFFSHMQSLPIEHALRTMMQFPHFVSDFNRKYWIGKETVYWWLDYTTLRQCVQDFSIPQAVIQEISLTVCEIDDDGAYFK